MINSSQPGVPPIVLPMALPALTHLTLQAYYHTPRRSASAVDGPIWVSKFFNASSVTHINYVEERPFASHLSTYLQQFSPWASTLEVLRIAVMNAPRGFEGSVPFHHLKTLILENCFIGNKFFKEVLRTDGPLKSLSRLEIRW
ncbi:hypothetical protein M422DRAFT_48319 [Sphaerobolus stellatus SS14]|uniref:Uncharacterized protein n=1 Tax=Sphaerobolus stellatus (strain SS14) TaxID=990650 RepID=A0A0C9VU47_SPHS4|nr:hypothetical protein M422DRAFT_48319 [Sphaerobolus stellatus SS14]